MERWLTEHGEYLILFFLVGCFLFLLIRQHILNKAPEYTASATVVSRRLGTARYHGKWSSGWNHLVTFQLGDGSTIELYTGKEEYTQLTEGLRGQLVWQHDNFLNFDTDIT